MFSAKVVYKKVMINSSKVKEVNFVLSTLNIAEQIPF